MERIGRGADEVEVFVESPGLVILRVHDQSTNAGNVRGMKGPKHGVLEKACADALALPPLING